MKKRSMSVAFGSLRPFGPVSGLNVARGSRTRGSSVASIGVCDACFFNDAMFSNFAQLAGLEEQQKLL